MARANQRREEVFAGSGAGIVFFSSGSDCSRTVQRTGFLDFADGLVYSGVFFFFLLLGTFLVGCASCDAAGEINRWGTRQVLFEMVLPDRAGGLLI